MSDTAKIDMITDYLMAHYPNGTDAERLAANPLVASAVLSSEYSNTQCEDIIDKVAIFNNIEKVD